MPVTQKLVKHGHSRAVIIPKRMLEVLEIRDADLVQLAIVEGTLVIRPVDVVPRPPVQTKEFID